MKKKLLFAAGAMVIAAAVSAAVCLNFGQTRHDDLFEQNLSVLAEGENKIPQVPCVEGEIGCETVIMSADSIVYSIIIEDMDPVKNR